MIGGLGALGALNTLGLEEPQVGFNASGGIGTETFYILTELGIILNTEGGDELRTE